MSIDDYLNMPTGEAIFILILSIALTFLMYAGFPILFAKFRKKKIELKKYKWICIGVIIGVALLYSFFSGYTTRGAPAAVWGMVGYYLGKRMLKKKGLITPEKPEFSSDNGGSQKEEGSEA